MFWNEINHNLDKKVKCEKYFKFLLILKLYTEMISLLMGSFDCIWSGLKITNITIGRLSGSKQLGRHPGADNKSSKGSGSGNPE